MLSPGLSLPSSLCLPVLVLLAAHVQSSALYTRHGVAVVYSLLQPCQDKLRFGGRGTGGRLPSICSCWLLSLPSSKTLRTFLSHQTIATTAATPVHGQRSQKLSSIASSGADTAPFLTSPFQPTVRSSSSLLHQASPRALQTRPARSQTKSKGNVAEMFHFGFS